MSCNRTGDQKYWSRTDEVQLDVSPNIAVSGTYPPLYFRNLSLVSTPSSRRDFPQAALPDLISSHAQLSHSSSDNSDTRFIINTPRRTAIHPLNPPSHPDTAHPHDGQKSQDPHCRRPPHQHGPDGLLPHPDPPAHRPPFEHDEVRPRRQETGPLPRGEEGQRKMNQDAKRSPSLFRALKPLMGR